GYVFFYSDGRTKTFPSEQAQKTSQK
ncbi:MAG: hypothetical protein RL210_1956, partial [Pseudomonadota bacterium]